MPFPERPADGDEAESRRHHADRLAAMGKLAAGVAHEVNNPAAYVAANTAMIGEHATTLSTVFRLLRDLLPEAGPVAERVERILTAYDVDTMIADMNAIVNENLDGVGRITAIVRDLGSFSRVEHDRGGPVHPNEVVNLACSLVNTKLRHRATLVKDVRETPMVVGDAGRLTQILTNLLINAAQAIPEGSDRQHTVSVRTRKRGDMILFEVEDDGPGIRPDLLPRIFEPFFTTKPDGEGTGLGLALARDIARSFGGDIEVTSTLGEGTRFVVSIPQAAPSVSVVREPTAAEVPRPPTTSVRARALVIDDDPMILKAYRRAFKKSVDIVTACDGEDALSWLLEDGNFDVVICDLMMPKVGGQDIYERIKAQAPALADRFVFVSGGVFTERGLKFVESIDNPVLAKPVSFSELSATVTEVATRGNG